MKPRLTEKVKRGLWIIVARSATLYSAEEGGEPGMDKDEREAILAAGRYAEAHWKNVATDGLLRGVPALETDDE